MHGSFNPFGSPAVLIDKLIGNAYDVVKYVACNMSYIKKVSYRVDDIKDLAESNRNTLDLRGNLKLKGQTVIISLPEYFIFSSVKVQSFSSNK